MNEIRAKLIQKTYEYRTSWFPELGQLLHTVKAERLYKKWEGKHGHKFRSFLKYCQHDLHIAPTVASDIANAYAYVLANHLELLEIPSDGKIKVPGYNEIAILIRVRDKIPKNKFIKLDKSVFVNGIGRDKLRATLKNLIPTHKIEHTAEAKIKELEMKVASLNQKIESLENELEFYRNFEFPEFKQSEILKLRRGISKYIHPDAGGNNELMRDFNALIDKLKVVAFTH